MIDFIVGEKEDSLIQTYREIIDKVMMDYDIEYQFNVISKDFPCKMIEKGTFKVVLLNFKKEKEEVGLKIANFIREELRDLKSILIFLTPHPEYQIELWKEKLFIFDLIDQTNHFYYDLERSIKRCLFCYDQRPNTLKYCYKGNVYNIDYHEIEYIEKEQASKRCLIKTRENDYYFSGTLLELEEQLDKRFLRTNRSYIVNLDQVEVYDMKENALHMKSGNVLYAVSRNQRKEMVEYIRNLHLKIICRKSKKMYKNNAS